MLTDPCFKRMYLGAVAAEILTCFVYVTSKIIWNNEEWQHFPFQCQLNITQSDKQNTERTECEAFS